MQILGLYVYILPEVVQVMADATLKPSARLNVNGLTIENVSCKQEVTVGGGNSFTFTSPALRRELLRTLMADMSSDQLNESFPEDGDERRQILKATNKFATALIGD